MVRVRGESGRKPGRLWVRSDLNALDFWGFGESGMKRNSDFVQDPLKHDLKDFPGEDKPTA